MYKTMKLLLINDYVFLIDILIILQFTNKIRRWRGDGLLIFFPWYMHWYYANKS